MLTYDLADSEVVSRATIGVPGCALDTVPSPCFKTIEGYRGVGGVHFVAGAGALSVNAECVEDGVLNLGPSHNDGVIGRGGGVQLWCAQHYRQRQTRTNEDWN